MLFVFVTDELPRPGRAGHLALNHAIIAWLRAQGHVVTVLLTSARLRWPAEPYPKRGVAGPLVMQVGGLVIARGLRAPLGILAKAALGWLPAPAKNRLTARRYAGADAVLGGFITSSQAAWCARYIKVAAPDAILIDTIFRADVLRAPDTAGINSVIIAHDVFYSRAGALRSAGYKVFPETLSRAAEAALLSLPKAVAAIQPAEAAMIRAMCPAQTVFTASMPALPCRRPEGTRRLPGRLVFVGSASLPNLDGLRWFFDDIWPILRRWRSDVTLDLAGDCGAALLKLPEGVTRLGRIANLGPVLHRAALAIAPLRVGSGLKIKLLDYARHGLLTVATPPSLEGFAADPAAPFIAATAAAGFAAAVVRQLDAGPAADERAYGYVVRHYGTAASFAGLGEALALRSEKSLAASVSAAFPFN